MKTRFVFRLVILIIGGIILLMTYLKIRTKRELDVIYNSSPIESIRINVITSPNFDEKRIFELTDKKTLDSINIYLKNFSEPVNIPEAKLNEVFVILEIQKGNTESNVEIMSSKYTGWLMIAGKRSFKNDYIFQFIQKYIQK
jgi:hypothetical protein